MLQTVGEEKAGEMYRNKLSVYSFSMFHIQMELSLQVIPLGCIQLAQFSDKCKAISVIISFVLKFCEAEFLMLGEGGLWRIDCLEVLLSVLLMHILHRWVATVSTVCWCFSSIFSKSWKGFFTQWLQPSRSSYVTKQLSANEALTWSSFAGRWKHACCS